MGMTKKKIIRGSDRRGWQAKNFLEDLKTDRDVFIDKPAVIIDTMRIVGDDLLTAADIALYEKLVAVARYKGIANKSHVISASDAMRYINVRHVSRLLDSLERITRTVVRYDFRTDSYQRRGSLPLLLAEVRDDLSAGTSMLHFEIPLAVRECILAARQYTMLNVAPYSRFKSRYASRLYPHLALRSGMTGEHGKKWEVTPQELAEKLGFPLQDGKLHYASFERRCLKPALKELDLCAYDFEVRMFSDKGTGRGKPVELLRFYVTKSSKTLVRTQSQKLSYVANYLISSNDPVHSRAEIPSKLFFGKAARKHNVYDVDLIAGWLAALDRAKAYPEREVVPNLLGKDFLENVAKDVNEAFNSWLISLAFYNIKIQKSRLPVAEVRRNQASEEYVEPEPTVVNATDWKNMSEEERVAQRRKNYKEYALDTVTSLKNKIEGRCVYQPHIKQTWSESQFYNDTGSDAYLWNCLYIHLEDDDERNLRNAADIMQKMEITALKRTLHTMCKAILEWDLEKVNAVARALYAAHKNKTLPLKSAESKKQHNYGTQQVTELAAEYDFGDPAYGRSVSFNDIDMSDLEAETL